MTDYLLQNSFPDTKDVRIKTMNSKVIYVVENPDSRSPKVSILLGFQKFI